MGEQGSATESFSRGKRQPNSGLRQSNGLRFGSTKLEGRRLDLEGRLELRGCAGGAMQWQHARMAEGDV